MVNFFGIPSIPRKKRGPHLDYGQSDPDSGDSFMPIDNTTPATRRIRWPRSPLGWAGLGAAIVVVLIAAILAYGFFGLGLVEMFRQPQQPFDARAAPPAPDYSRPDAWLAFPGRDGRERSTPPGFAAVDESKAPADVFFIHPTTYLKNGLWVAP